MSSEVENKRRYHSPRRQEQAEETRRKVLYAARDLFVMHGYAATTLPSIARAAGVSTPTVTALFGTKTALLKALIRLGVRGDEAPDPLALRSWWQDMLSEHEPTKQLRLFAAETRRIHERTTDIFEIVRGAATADPEIALLRSELTVSHLQDSSLLAEALAENQALASELTVSRATDLLWALGSAEMYRLLVVERRWPVEQYEQWLYIELVHSLL